MQGSSRPPGKDELRVGYTVMVGSIPDRAEVRDLEDALRPFGAIDEIRFLPIKKNRARCAFVQFTSPASAEHVLKERKLVVCGFKVRTSKYFLRGGELRETAEREREEKKSFDDPSRPPRGSCRARATLNLLSLWCS